jgi:hypothetical protein
MMHSKLNYQGIEKVVLERFPELAGPVEQTFGSYYDLKTESPEAYPVFESVLQEFVVKLLEANDNDPLIRRIFSFFEEMASSVNINVVNLLWIAILKPLLSQPEHVESAWKHMGERTKEMSREIAQFEGWQENLPRGQGSPGNGH